jgi:hypothetical protein
MPNRTLRSPPPPWISTPRSGIGGDHVDRAVAFLVRHPSLGPRDEGRSLDDGDDRSHGA